MLAVYKKELRSYFIGPIGYIYMALYLLVSSLIFTYTTLYAGTCDVTTYYTFILYLFAILIPLLTMRMLSEEKKSRTEQILLTSPVSLTSVIFAKFLAAFTLFAGTLLISCLHFIILFAYGTPSTAIMISTTLGILLIGAAFVAIGIFVSACTENQLVAALVTIVAIASTLVLNVLSGYVSFTPLRVVMRWLSVFDRFYAFTYGYFDFVALLYYVSVTVVFLFLTVRVFEKRRWE
ncbi:MAG: ABC transporter permease [Clostridia bacterium]|nr:ABC transporter permease [Clostridia bacterium]